MGSIHGHWLITCDALHWNNATVAHRYRLVRKFYIPVRSDTPNKVVDSVCRRLLFGFGGRAYDGGSLCNNRDAYGAGSGKHMEYELAAADTNNLLSLFGLVVPVVTAAITGLFAYRLGTKRESTKTEAVLHGGFKILIDELQAERNRLSDRLSKLIDAGNIDLMRNINDRFSAIEAQIDHNRRNADHNFGIINEIIHERTSAPDAQPSMRGKRRLRLPQRLPKRTNPESIDSG